MTKLCFKFAPIAPKNKKSWDSCPKKNPSASPMAQRQCRPTLAIAPRPATAAVTGNCVAHSYHKFPKEPAAAAGHLALTKTHRCRRLKGKKGPSRAFSSSPRPRRLCSTSQIVLIPLLGDVHQVGLQNVWDFFGPPPLPCPHSVCCWAYSPHCGCA